MSFVAVMTQHDQSNLGMKAFIWLNLPHQSSSSKEVRSSHRGHEGVQLTGLLPMACSICILFFYSTIFFLHPGYSLRLQSSPPLPFFHSPSPSPPVPSSQVKSLMSLNKQLQQTHQDRINNGAFSLNLPNEMDQTSQM